MRNAAVASAELSILQIVEEVNSVFRLLDLLAGRFNDPLFANAAVISEFETALGDAENKVRKNSELFVGHNETKILWQSALDEHRQNLLIMKRDG